jgi:hypothetical protein
MGRHGAMKPAGRARQREDMDERALGLCSDGRQCALAPLRPLRLELSAPPIGRILKI